MGRMLGLWAVFTDPPKHTHLRGLMNTAFTTRAVERLQVISLACGARPATRR